MIGSFIYFMRPVGMDGPIKIGCSDRPSQQLEAYRRWSPFPLEIVAMIAGPRSLEFRFHAKFKDSFSHFEWFHPSDELTATIAAINAGTFDVEALPKPIRVYNLHKQAA